MSPPQDSGSARQVKPTRFDLNRNRKDIIMNRKTLITATAFALLGATSAFAQEATSDTWQQVQATKSRAEVQAELLQARKDGSIKFGSAGYIEPLKSVRSRAEVRAEVAQARASGELDAINGEVYGFQPQPAVRLARNAR